MKNYKIGIIGLGYVGLPLALEFGKKFETIGFDLNNNRINNLSSGIDKNGEFSKRNIRSSLKITFTSRLEDLTSCNVYIIAVPTPINKDKTPNLKILLDATSSVGTLLKKNDIVIYESTVYPGCTEEDCVPILERVSKLKYNKDFFCGYSPERINPGDKKKTLTKILKITSGSTPEITKKIDNIYKSIITAGTFPVSSIKIAEAAKIIENCQRDINIAFVNELSILFNLMNIDTNEVLEAAGTKWNFLPFYPGLVGGHCISVDPYYLTYKAKKIGYDSKIISSARQINDSMPKYVVDNMMNYFKNSNFILSKINILLLGITFKENCSDARNSKVIDIYKKLEKNNFTIHVYDPYAIKSEIYEEYKIDLIDYLNIKNRFYHCVVVAVSHDEFKNLNVENYCISNKALIYDLKGIYNNKKYRRL